ncbi:MAG: DUF262 domain-containing protein [Brevinematales bacterium]
MKAEAKSLKFLTMEGEVIIPFFQRSYVWTEENWQDLLDELSNEEKSQNFLGAIILKQLPSLTGKSKQLEVIDGQQRLTTLSILLKALLDSFPDEIKENFKNNVLEILKYKRDYTVKESEIRIKHSHVDKDAYEKVINGSLGNNDINDINENSHRILQCYKYFIEKLSSNNYDKTKLLNKLLDTENKMLVVIDLDEKDDEQSIFDTLNTAGVRLTIAEIVKNSLFKRAIELSNKEIALELYNETWQNTFLKDKDTLDYWSTERTTGRLKRDNIEILLHCVGVIKGFYDPDKHSLTELSKLYKKQINNINSIDDLKDFIKEIIDYANIYKEKIVNFDKSYLFSFNNDFIRLLHILDELEISTFHPFIIYLFKNKEEENRNLIFKKLEKFIVLNMLTKKENTKNYNKLCKQFINNNDLIDQKLNEFSWNDIIESLHKINNKNASLILFWIELYRRIRDNKYDIKELKYNYSLEHIMPQNWEENWSFDNVPHPDRNLTFEQQQKDRNEKIYWLGNMTLLKSSLNSSLSNQSYEKKIIGEGRKKGMKDYASLSITRDDIITPFENGDKIWNENKIIERTNKLANEIKEIWFNS